MNIWKKKGDVMELETLVSSVNQDVEALAGKMNLQTKAIIINQCEKNEYCTYYHREREVRCYSFAERGVGLSRNNALLRSSGDIVLFSDEDIVYEDGYDKKILKAFEENPEADMLLFNMEVESERATYHIEKKHRIFFYNSGRYPTYSFAIRREKLFNANITFSLLFGGGARYSNGEDSLFLMDCLRKKFKIYALPITIGREVPRPSTWFFGYTEKFFYDRGVLYHHLYGKFKYLMAVRFLVAHKNKMCREIQVKEAFRLMKKGMREAVL